MVTLAQTEQTIQTTADKWRGQAALVAKPGGPHTGVGRYVQTLQQELQEQGVATTRIAPAVPPLPNVGYTALRRLGVDARAFLTNFPIWANDPRSDVYHIMSQNLATLLLFRRPRGKVIVTVHDIIPYMLRDHPQLSSYRTAADRLFDRMAMAGLRRAHHLIADSHYTLQCLVAHLGIPAARITVAYLGIDHTRFRPLPVPASIRTRYALPADRRYLIYVGSEDPRKNLTTLVQALAEIRQTLPDVELIKVGRAHFDQERQQLCTLADQLGVRPAIRFLDDVPEDDLPVLYNLASAGVLPSLYEGFGFPVLESMACGTPVVCARAASLPELVGDAALLFDPGPAAAHNLAAAILRLLSKPDLYQMLRTMGLERAATFRWSRCAQQVRAVYAGQVEQLGDQEETRW